MEDFAVLLPFELRRAKTASPYLFRSAFAADDEVLARDGWRKAFRGRHPLEIWIAFPLSWLMGSVRVSGQGRCRELIWCVQQDHLAVFNRAG